MHDIEKINSIPLVLQFVRDNTPVEQLRNDILRYFVEASERMLAAMKFDPACDPALHYRTAVYGNDNEPDEQQPGFSFVLKYDDVIDGGFVALKDDKIVDFVIIDSPDAEVFNSVN